MRYLLLVLLACTAAVQARPEGGLLQQPGTCTKWCADEASCRSDRVSGAVRCVKCQQNMVRIRSGPNAGACGCGRWRYFSKDLSQGDEDATCKWCEAGSYCDSKSFHVPENALDSSLQYGVNTCQNGLTTKAAKSDESKCTNPPGYYYVPANSATNQPAGAEPCTGDTFSKGFGGELECTRCPSGFKIDTSVITTPEQRTSAAACSVQPGFYLSGPRQALPCPRGSYQPDYLPRNSPAGINSCIRCGTGVTTSSTGSTSAADCNRLLPGFYASGSNNGALTASLCPMGWICPGSAPGDTTPVAVLIFTLPSNSPVPNLTSGDASAGRVVSCADAFRTRTQSGAFFTSSRRLLGLWTRQLGSTNSSECLIPPGHRVQLPSGGLSTADNAQVVRCDSGQYEDRWIRPTYQPSVITGANGAAPNPVETSCQVCGTDIGSEQITALAYTKSTGDQETIFVRGSADACVLTPGWGMYRVSISNSNPSGFEARKCNAAAGFGTATKAYGLELNPCRPCPANMDLMTINNNQWNQNQYSENGNTIAIRVGNDILYVDPTACVTRPGYGYTDSRGQQCDEGTYNTGGNRNPCTPCGYGLTSVAGSDEASDCRLAPGFARVAGVATECPQGTYSDEAQQLTSDNIPCDPCPNNRYTIDVGADAESDCLVCKPGYGTTNIASGCSECGPRKYGPDAAGTACVDCPAQTIGFTFFYKEQVIPYTSLPVAKTEASSSADCVSEFAQIQYGWWSLSGAATPHGANTLAACVSACLAYKTAASTDDCMFVTFTYTASAVASPPESTQGSCQLAITQDNSATHITAFKTVLSGDFGGGVRTRSVSTGLYTLWNHDAGAAGNSIGTLVPLTGNAASSKAAAYAACDGDSECAGVTCEGTAAAITNCKKILGASTAGSAARSLTRAVPLKMT